MRLIAKASMVAIAFTACSGMAMAQVDTQSTAATQTSATIEPVGEVVSATEDLGSVVVERRIGDGTQTQYFSLSPDDQLFPGDVVLTSAQGGATIRLGGCDAVELDPAEKLVVPSTGGSLCSIAPVAATEAELAAIGSAVAAGEVGAAAFLAPLAVVTGGLLFAASPG